MRVLSLDFETSIGKTVHKGTFRDPLNDIYTQIYASNCDNQVHIEHNKEGFKRTLSDNIIKMLPEHDYIVGHNIGFDLSYIWHSQKLKQYILQGGRIWCTQYVEYLLTGMQHKLSSLAELELKYLNKVSKVSKISSLFANGTGADQILQDPTLTEDYEEYCLGDGIAPIEIFYKQYAIAKERGMLPIIEIYNQYLLAQINMMVTGLDLDVIACEKAIRDLSLKVIELEKQLNTIIMPLWDKRLPAFKINSTDHKSVILFGGHLPIKVKIQDGFYKNGNPRYTTALQSVAIKGFGVPTRLSTPLAKGGFYSTSESVIREIALKTKNDKLQEYCNVQLEILKANKIINTYCKGYLATQVNGKIHTNLNNTITETSRLSSSEPNLQNIAKRSVYAKLLWGFFTAPEGWTPVVIDFSQLEVWCLALLSGDEQLLHDLLNGLDFHCLRVTYFTDKTYDEVYELVHVTQDPEWVLKRSQAKSVGFSMQYGGGVKSISEKNDIDPEIVKTILEKEAETYPKAANFGKLVLELAEENKELSYKINTPDYQNIVNKNGIELLPIFDKSGKVVYNNEEYRYIGKYQSVTGKIYNLLETGNITDKGRLRKQLPFTYAKNYPVQGTAGDIQAMTSAALLNTILAKSDRIKQVLEIHDSKLFLVRTDVLEPCLKYLKSTIEDVPKLFMDHFNLKIDFKFPVGIEVGSKSFADVTKHEVK